MDLGILGAPGTKPPWIPMRENCSELKMRRTRND